MKPLYIDKRVSIMTKNCHIVILKLQILDKKLPYYVN